ncbi:hypothetical protein WICPIJ_002912 [Wickerhamomyces pijperi]|uniref:Uncharacterized protein n=1 Tax=Wickerhamomyces pijperi TaxID=599730 RepID=A0A9P8Q8P4_WICPI|nr:hypothetical protein WICPIJ_002912 [Wickerhamomyces pijperi]
MSGFKLDKTLVLDGKVEAEADEVDGSLLGLIGPDVFVVLVLFDSLAFLAGLLLLSNSESPLALFLLSPDFCELSTSLSREAGPSMM